MIYSDVFSLILGYVNSVYSFFLVSFINLSKSLLSLIFNKDIVNYIKLLPEAIDFIKELEKNNVKLGIVTSDSIVSTKLTLDQFNLNHCFKSVIARESLNETKESGKPMLLALKELNSKKERTIMIGDAPMDYLAAKNAGIEKTILVSTGQLLQEDLSKISEYTVSSLDEIDIIKC